MKRRILMGIVLLGLLVSLLVTYGRIKVEQASPEVEVVLDWTSFADFNAVWKEPPTQLLRKFREAGVTSVAIYEKTLKEYAKSNDVAIYQGKDLVSQYYFSSGSNNSIISSLYQGPSDLDNVFVLFHNKDMYSKIRQQIASFPGEFILDTYEDNVREIFIIELENGGEHLENLPLGFDEEEIQMIISQGLKIVPRISDTRERLYGLQGTLSDLQERGGVTKVIFNGTKVSGYPNKLKETAQILNDLGLHVGMIEPFIAYQEGIKELAPLVKMNIVRVHSIKGAEMEKYSFIKVLDRYIRAVKERNVRVLYYKPFLSTKENLNPMALNKKFVKDLQTELSKDGYTFGVAKPFPNERTSYPWIVIIALGVYAAGLLLLDRLIRVPAWLAYGLLTAAALFTALLCLKGYVLLTRDLLGLLAAIVLPSLAIIVGYEEADQLKPAQNQLRMATTLFVKVTGYTLIGVAFIIGLLSDVRYIYQVNQFRGIKFTFILPLIIISIYYLKRIFDAEGLQGYVRMLKQSITLLNQPVRYFHIALLGLLGVAGLIYIGRTGNTPILPVSAFELQLREWLEDVFVYRPRFKELLGHPFLLLTFYYMLSQKKRFVYPLLMIGAIGQLTIINTYSHIHTPVLASTTRVGIGLVLGVLGGVLLVWIYRWLEKGWNKYWGQIQP